jgi:hypothetical protein
MDIIYEFKYIYLSIHIEMNEDRNIHINLLIEYEYRIFWIFLHLDPSQMAI